MIARIIALIAAILAAFAAVVAGLVAFSRPPEQPQPAAGESLDFSAAISQDLAGLPEPTSWTARDGTALVYRRYDPEATVGRVVVLVHGSGWHGMQFHAMASALARQDLATVIVPDLRGHGRDPERRGDVDHIGQLEEDLADLIGHLRALGLDGRMVLGGHSSGGGLVIRFAGGPFGKIADAFLLMAPFLKYDAPTTRLNSGGWARPATPRIIGLSILNGLGIAGFNHLPVISFAMPHSVLDGPLGATATTRYSHRMNVSFAPRPDFGADLAAMTAPFLLVAGDKDEAFIAEAYEPTIAEHTDAGSYRVLPGISHLGIVSDPAAIETVATWLATLPRND